MPWGLSHAYSGLSDEGPMSHRQGSPPESSSRPNWSLTLGTDHIVLFVLIFPGNEGFTSRILIQSSHFRLESSPWEMVSDCACQRLYCISGVRVGDIKASGFPGHKLASVPGSVNFIQETFFLHKRFPLSGWISTRNTMSTETTTYNVYRVYFSQARGPDHEGIALVPAQNSDQGAGRFYHVMGDVGTGMTYEKRPGYRFSGSKSYKSSALQFQLPKTQLDRFESIAAKHPPPHDPRTLTEANPNPPARNCSDWVADVLAESKSSLT